MTKKEQIRQSLRRLASVEGPVQTILAKVLNVNPELFICTVLDDETEINEVRLRPVLNGKQSITVYPKEGSWVLIQRIEEDLEWIVVAVDEIDKIRISIDDMLFEMKNGKYLVMSGDDSLKDVLRLIIEAMQVIMVIQGNNPDYVKLQTALDKLNNLMD
jgi:hypothetical protein